MLKRSRNSKSESQVNKLHKTSYGNNYNYPYTKGFNILKYPDKDSSKDSKGIPSIPDYYFDDDPPYVGFKANKYNDINWLDGYGSKNSSSSFQSNKSFKLPKIRERENTVDSIQSTSKLENTRFFLPEITKHSPLQDVKLVRDVATAMSDKEEKEQKYKKTTITLGEETKDDNENFVYYLVDDDDFDYVPAPYPYYPPNPYYNPYANYGSPPPPGRLNPFNQPPGPGFNSFPSQSFNGFPPQSFNGFPNNSFNNSFSNQSFSNFNDNPNSSGVLVKYSHFPTHSKDKT